MTNEKLISPADIPQPLVDKYSRSGPRYTSYPTAPQFEETFDRETAVEKWKETNDTTNALSIYSHFPFCPSRCRYCGCYTYTGKSQDIKQDYLEAVKKDSEHLFTVIDPDREVHQLAFGGGTPTHMLPEQLTEYICHLESMISFNPDAERSIEVDPRGVNGEYLDQLIDLSFNRFSFGVQDLDPKVQKIINRVLEPGKLEDHITHLRKMGAEAINLDLIYGLPGQTVESFSTTIKKILELKPSRLALFGYAHVPWVSPHQKAMEKHGIPGPAERVALFGKAFEMFLEAGYQHVGMDHFARPEDELIRALNSRTLTRNFMGYTTRRGLDLIGIGASSISSVGVTYTQNEKDLNKFKDHAGGLSWIKGLIMSPEDILRRELIMDLFCNFYLDTAVLEEKFQIDFARHFAGELETLLTMEADGLLEIKGDEKSITVTRLGRFFIRNICMPFDQYLNKDKVNPENRYSKTI